MKLLLYTCKPSLLCLSETWVKEGFLPTFVGYRSFWRNRDGHGGGVCILVRDSLCCSEIRLLPFGGGFLELHAVRLRLSTGDELSVLNVYNPVAPVTSPELQHYVDQLQPPFLITGDFNAHSPLLSSACTRPNIVGRSLEAVLTNNAISLLNDLDFYTYIDRRSGRRSCLDLFLVSSCVSPYFRLRLLHDVGSDHYPVMATSTVVPLALDSVPVPRWRVTSSGLNSFASAVPPSDVVLPTAVQELSDDLTSRLTCAAAKCFSRSSGQRPDRLVSPWWSEECRAAVLQRRRARRALERRPTRELLIAYKRHSAAARYCILTHKRAYKRLFISSLSYTTPLGVAWKKIRFMRSKSREHHFPISVDGALIASTLEKANSFCRAFARISTVGRVRAPGDLHRTITTSWSGEADYNQPFSGEELDGALRGLRNSSPGGDDIPYSFLRALDDSQSGSLLSLFNASFQLGVLPDSWKAGIVLPILKPGKDPSLLGSYRPITLLSCVGKLFERLLATRLSHVVESRSLLFAGQCGFRPRLSTLDVLLRLEESIRAAQASREICLVVHVDLASAFDKVWLDGLLYKLALSGIRGALARWLSAYLTDRSSCVRINGVTSRNASPAAGVPQGAVLSPMLFNFMLRDIPVIDGVDVLLYADDITLCCRGATMLAAKSLMQRYLDTLRDFNTSWGLSVNVDKTVFQYFSHKRVNVPVLRYGNRALAYRRQHKLLGLVFDAPRLLWGPHLRGLCCNVVRRMDILKHLASPNWGANRKFLRQFYCLYIRAKIDYGCLLYRTASDSLLSRLDVLQNSCMRLILGARRTSPILSLQAETHLSPLSLRRQFLAARYFARLQCRPVDDVTSRVVCASAFSVLRDGRRLLRMFGVPHLRRTPVPSVDPVPPWSSVAHLVRLDFGEGHSSSLPVIFEAFLCDHYPGFQRVFCDGSRSADSSSTACGLFLPSRSHAVSWRLHPAHSVVAAELIAVYQALQLVSSESGDCWVVCSDSAVALQLITRPNDTCRDLVYRIRSCLVRLNVDRTVQLQWAKAHVGILGNERADQAAKLGHSLDRSALFPLSYSDVAAFLRRSFVRHWEVVWLDALTGSGKGLHLAGLRSDLSPVPWVACHTRRVAVVLARLRLGHVGVRSYLFRFNMADTPTCLTCGVSDTVEHFLLSCRNFSLGRRELTASLCNLGIPQVSVRIMLGGGPYPRTTQHAIIKATIQYLKSTDRLSML